MKRFIITYVLDLPEDAGLTLTKEMVTEHIFERFPYLHGLGIAKLQMVSEQNDIENEAVDCLNYLEKLVNKDIDTANKGFAHALKANKMEMASQTKAERKCYQHVLDYIKKYRNSIMK